MTFMDVLGKLSSIAVGLITAYLLYPILERKMKSHAEVAKNAKNKESTNKYY